MKINLLITSISRKIWLIEAFKQALKKAGLKGRIISVDVDPLSAGRYISDAYYSVPSSSDKNFIPSIIKICKKEGIKLIIPTRDGELSIFSRNIDKFEKENIRVMISKPEIIEMCRDKYSF